MVKLKVGILVHQQDLNNSYWVMDILMTYWERVGHKVYKVSTNQDDFPCCDLWIAHLDTSVVCSSLLEKIPDGVKIVNENILDIRREVYSDRIVTSKSNYSGEVIVKARNNYGGIPERNMVRNMLKEAPIWKKKIMGPFLKTSGYTDYSVFNNLSQVPRKYLRNKDLVIEKFLPQREKDYYVLYYSYFLGEVTFTFKMRSYKNVFKWAEIEDYKIVETPAEATEWAAKNRLGYGKLDYSFPDGKFCLYDVNKTPGLGPSDKDEFQMSEDGVLFYETLANGLKSL